MKSLLLVVLAMALAGLIAEPVFAQGDAEVKPQTTPAAAQTTCPVMGNPIDKQCYADYEGKRVYFCCPMCLKPFKENPAEYVKKLEDAGVTLEKAPVAQTTCPVSDKPIDKQHFVDYDGKRVYFCCPNCPAEFNKDPGKYVKKLEDAGVTLEKAPVAQTTCPNSGKPIDKNYFADYNGKRVYFCGPGCVQAFKADPEPYVQKLEAAGVTLEDAPATVKSQTMCPVTNEPISKGIYADYEGKRVYFCCRNCQRTFRKNPAKWVKLLEDQGITLAAVPGSS